MKLTGVNKAILDNLQTIKDWNQKNYNVLVLDDDPSMSNLIRSILGRSHKAKIYTFQDELSAIRSFYESSYDMCILDVSLEHSNGFALGKLLRSMSHREFPIIYISKERDYLVEFYRNAQPNSFFYPKPIINSNFLKVFEKMVE